VSGQQQTPDALPLEKEAQYPFYMRMGGSLNQCGCGEREIPASARN